MQNITEVKTWWLEKLVDSLVSTCHGRKFQVIRCTFEAQNVHWTLCEPYCVKTMKNLESNLHSAYGAESIICKKTTKTE